MRRGQAGNSPSAVEAGEDGGATGQTDEQGQQGHSVSKAEIKNKMLSNDHLDFQIIYEPSF